VRVERSAVVMLWWMI